MGVSENDIKTLKDAARLHDIGKIGIEDQILKKAGVLSDEEWEIMRRHPEIGESIVRPLKTFKHLLEPIRHHHEFLDGTGYPQGLKGDAIPLMTRILTVADIYDAMTSDRSYRSALSDQDVRDEFRMMIEQNKIDSRVVDVLFNLLEQSKL
jgi:HD-GYP domain-containing protein (c-di-GMP phosphodiesterase class II)